MKAAYFTLTFVSYGSIMEMEMVDQSKSWFLHRGPKNYLVESEITVRMS